jgi:hypothetical protein
MLLNETPVLDKGFVAPLEFSGSGKLIQHVQDAFFKTKTNMDLLKICSATLVIKCPLFVQLNLSKYGFDIISTPSEVIEAYIPDVSMIEAESLEDKERISEYMEATTEALLLNQKGLPMDGVSPFTAQLMTPITVYNRVIVHGSLSQWILFIKQGKTPKEISLYREAVFNCLSAQWKNLKVIMENTK